MFHGEERTKRTEVEAGKTAFRKREKYCVLHGWIDVFGIGGDLEWQRQHGKCNRLPKSVCTERRLAA